MEINHTELARSWFVLAEILAVLSGLFILSLGLIQIPENSIDLLNKAVNVCENINLNNEYVNFSACFEKLGLESTISRMNIMNKFYTTLFALGILIAIDSLLFWGLGRIILTKPTVKDKNVAFLIVVVTVILFIFYFLIIQMS